MKIELELNEKDMEAIEDRFFGDLTNKQYNKVRPRLLKIWERLCKAMGDEE